MIIVYKVSPLSYLVGRLIINVKNIGLVNIIANKTIVPELIQKDANGEPIATAALAILTNEGRKLEIIRELAAIRAKLGSPGAARRAAQLALDML
jgi:Lipid A disaccharide synthetase